MSQVVFSDEAWADYLFWQTQDKKTLKRINQLIESISREGPMQGIGKPERLKYENEYYSRRIDEKNRLMYDVEGQRILIKSCRGHYHGK